MLKTAKTKEEIPAQFQATAFEGKEGWAYEDDGGLKAKNAELLTKNSELAGRMTAMEAALGGLKPEDIARTVNESKAKEEEALRKAGKFDELLANALKKKDEEYAPKVKAGDTAVAELNSMKLDRVLDEALIASGVIAEDLPTARAILKAEVRGKPVVKYFEGKPVVFDKDGDQISADVKTFVSNSWKGENKKFFDGNGSEGGGAKDVGKTPAAAKGAAKVMANDDRGFLANLDTIAEGTTAVVFAQ